MGASAAERRRTFTQTVDPAPLRVVPRPGLPEPPFLVAGLGRAGDAALEALLQLFDPRLIWAWDGRTTGDMLRMRHRLRARGIRSWVGAPPGKRQIRWIRTVVKSPGISFEAPVIRRARAAGLELLDELELGWRLTSAPIVAVTGTNGKSTVADLTTALLAASGARIELAGNTEFGPPLSAVPRDLDWIVAEVSSFQLEGCSRLRPELAVLTNFTDEHLGRHRTMERYGEIKRRLFVRGRSPVSHAVICTDDAFGRRLASDLERLGGSVTRVGFAGGSDYRIRSAEWDLRRAAMTVQTPAGPVEVRSRLPGEHNARNVAAALAVADLLGIDRRLSLRTIGSRTGVLGRFEHLDAGQPFEVIVDFAHNPDAFDQLLRTVRAGMHPSGRLITVLGLGGRPGKALQEIGRLGRERSDRLVLTTCGAFGMPPIPGLGAVLSGARTTRGGELAVVLDRRLAISRALEAAARDDVVLIPGRGATRQMVYDPRGTPVAFDDRRVALEILARLVQRGGLATQRGKPQGAPRAVRSQSATETPSRLKTVRSPSSAV